MENAKDSTLVFMPSRATEEERQYLPFSESLKQEEAESLHENPEPESETPLRLVPLRDIDLSKYQVRQEFSENELQQLANSIDTKGVLQPILLRANKNQDPEAKPFELIAGERRFRAASLAELHHVPALVVEFDDRETLEAAIVENEQRENLNPVEQALAYQRLTTEFKLTQKDIAAATGKSRVTISNALRLLQLDEQVLELLRQGELSAGHGRALLMLDEPKLQKRFAKRALEQSLSVHALEKKIASFIESREVDELDEEEERELKRIERLQNKVADYLGLEEVGLRLDSQGRKRLNLTFETEASWKRFVAKIRD